MVHPHDTGRGIKEAAFVDLHEGRFSECGYGTLRIQVRSGRAWEGKSAGIAARRSSHGRLGMSHALYSVHVLPGMHRPAQNWTRKYLQCPRGVYEIKYFFSAGVSGSEGEGISSNSIKEFIKEIVENEDPKKPYSDQKMVEIFEEKGIAISRRTVAKYRDEMGILSSSKRKRF